ncbi:hypothetical protein EJB05_10685, partial [Eragrostis curvula]
MLLSMESGHQHWAGCVSGCGVKEPSPTSHNRIMMCASITIGSSDFSRATNGGVHLNCSKPSSTTGPPCEEVRISAGALSRLPLK